MQPGEANYVNIVNAFGKEIQTYRMTTYTFGLRCNMTQKPMIVLTGPTAVGKIDAEIQLSER